MTIWVPMLSSLLQKLPVPIGGFALATLAGIPVALGQSFNANDPAQSRAWAAGATAHAQKMRMFKDPQMSSQPAPPVIPFFAQQNDPFGKVATFHPSGPTLTAKNPFFQDLGTNGRTCFTCHQPQTGWTVSAASVEARFKESSGTDPIFRLVDGATCPSDDVSTVAARRKAYALLTKKGLIRIGLPLPSPAILQFEVTKVSDPYHCTTNPVTGLTSPTSGTVSVYRRPLPAANLGFLSTIMWDGREPTLEDQAVDATTGHAQGVAGPNIIQQAQIIAFETDLFTAQSYDNKARALYFPVVKGGPGALATELTKFFIGINDPLGNNPKGTKFDPNIFDLYKYWRTLRGNDMASRQRESIARGEKLFNTTKINITGVSGLNDELGKPAIAGFCGTCHDTPNVGNHSVKAPLDIGIADAGKDAPPDLDIAGLPVFTLTCTHGPLAGKVYVVTDPGRALISGQCKDIGRLKGPVLRGLASRAPYFHNGSAATLMDVVNFYDDRFKLGFTNTDKEDLVNFLNAL